MGKGTSVWRKESRLLRRLILWPSNVSSTVTSLYSVLVLINKKGVCSPAPGRMAWRVQHGLDFSSHMLSGLSALMAVLKSPPFADPIFLNSTNAYLSSYSVLSLGTVLSIEEGT